MVDDVENMAVRIAKRVSRPWGVTLPDAVNDAVVILLTIREEEVPKAGVDTQAWYYVRALGMLRDKYHSQMTRTPPTAALPSNLSVDDADPSVSLDVESAIENLPPRLAYVARAALIESRSQREIAEHLGIQQSAVHRLVTQARESLARILKDYN